MTLRKIMQEARQNLLKEQRKLEKLLGNAPQGTLIYSKNKANNKIYYKWYVSVRSKNGKRTKTYIPGKNRNYARELADHNLILTYESDGHPFDITIAQDKIKEFFDCDAVALY